MASTKIINVLKDDTLDELLGLFSATEAQEVIFVLPKRGKFLSKEDHFQALADAAKEKDKIVSILCSNPDTNQRAGKFGFQVLQQKEVKTSKTKTTTAQLAKMPPPLADDIYDDSSDAYQGNVPSDETMGIEEDKDEEDDATGGMRIIDPDADDDSLDEPTKKPAKDDDLEDNAIGEDDLGSGNHSEIEEFYGKNNGKADADFAISDVHTPQDYEIRAALRSQRNLDAILQPSGPGKRSVKVAPHKEKTAPVEIAHPRTRSSDDDAELETVWRDTQGNERQDASLWSKIPKFKKSGKSGATKSRKKFIVWAIVILACIGAAAYAYPESALITIKPVSQPLNMQVKVELGDSIGSVDPVFNKIPGQLFNVEHSVSQDFPATGQKEVSQKARGTITVSNTYGTTPQTLIATTRFESSGGLIFHTLKTITIPGTRVENGKILPGSVTVDIIADKPGPTYNIAPGKFTIPAFKEKGDTDRYQKFYGESTKAFTQGASGLAKVVTDADFAKAKETVTNKLTSEIRDLINTQAANLKTIGSPEITFKPLVATAQPDEAADTFTLTMAGVIRTIGYKESDVIDFITQYVKKTQGLQVIADKMTYTLSAASVPADKNAITTTLQAKGTVFAMIDSQKIIRDLLGKSETDLKIYLKDLPSIVSAKVNIQSLFGNRVPKDSAKVKLDIDYGN